MDNIKLKIRKLNLTKKKKRAEGQKWASGRPRKRYPIPIDLDGAPLGDLWVKAPVGDLRDELKKKNSVMGPGDPRGGENGPHAPPLWIRH